MKINVKKTRNGCETVAIFHFKDDKEFTVYIQSINSYIKKEIQNPEIKNRMAEIVENLKIRYGKSYENIEMNHATMLFIHEFSNLMEYISLNLMDNN